MKKQNYSGGSYKNQTRTKLDPARFGKHWSTIDFKITKKRKHVKTYEQSVLDLFLFCQKMLPYVNKMCVDEQGTYQLTKFSYKQNKITETDHSTLVLQINLEFAILKPQRIEE
jgi:hypothetical protein